MNTKLPVAMFILMSLVTPTRAGDQHEPRGQAADAARPLLEPWPGPYGGVPPWDEAQPDRFPAAFEAALAEEWAEIEAIAGSDEPPTFVNTIEALERSGWTRDRVERMFAVLRVNLSSPEVQAVDREWQPRLAAQNDRIAFHAGLFERIEAVYEDLSDADLTPEQQRLATRYHESFVRRGARLDEAGKERLSEINQRLAGLFSEFRSRVLADEDAWTVIEREEDLAGLPDSMVAAARSAAGERGLEGVWIILNTRSSVDPFLTFSAQRDLREQVWRKFKSRGDNDDENDTKAIIAEIVKLRADRARLLGYETHAHWRMEDTMARDPEAARALMMEVWPAAVARVREEVAEMQAIADREGHDLTIEPWDYLFYAEKVRQATYDLDHSQLEPYFQSDKMIEAAMWSAGRLYDLGFREITGTVPVFHPDVRVWEVTDAAGEHQGLFYLDNWARAGKRSGAWASSYRVQHELNGGATAITSNNNNFIRGVPGEPALISLDDGRTLFHEFGHSLHALLQEIRYPGLATTPRDFVEYPSQVNERWLLTREVLDRFALHYRTGEPIPQGLVDRVHETAKFNQGYETVEYLAAAILDMDLHTIPDGVFDPVTFEREGLERIGMPREIALRHRLPHFDHLFGSDAYSAGYYSYLWSDVMASDTWQTFLEGDGPWDREVADRLREHILSDGNRIDRAEAYRGFRGRDPDVTALLEDRGFPTNEQR